MQLSKPDARISDHLIYGGGLHLGGGHVRVRVSFLLAGFPT